MADREKVIRALENCTAREQCRDCPWESCNYDNPALRMPLDLAQEALELLKEEPVEPKIGGNAGPFGTQWYQCGSCSGQIDPKDQFCRNCGRPIKWE